MGQLFWVFFFVEIGVKMGEFLLVLREFGKSEIEAARRTEMRWAIGRAKSRAINFSGKQRKEELTEEEK